jgi:hypothetical protein
MEVSNPAFSHIQSSSDFPIQTMSLCQYSQLMHEGPLAGPLAVLEE